MLLWLVCSISSHFLHQLQHNKISSSSQTRNAANPFCFKSSVLSLRFHIGHHQLVFGSKYKVTKLFNKQCLTMNQHGLNDINNYIICFIGPCACSCKPWLCKGAAIPRSTTIPPTCCIFVCVSEPIPDLCCLCVCEPRKIVQQHSTRQQTWSVYVTMQFTPVLWLWQCGGQLWGWTPE